MNIVWEILATATRQEKEIRGIQVEREAGKLPLYADDMILYMENPKDEFSKIAGYKINIQKYVEFLLLTVKYEKETVFKKERESPI